MRFPVRAGYVIGILIGLGVIVGGGILFLRGLKEPGIPIPVGPGARSAGNLPVWVGAILILMGLAIVTSVADVAIRTWEGEDSEEI